MAIVKEAKSPAKGTGMKERDPTEELLEMTVKEDEHPEEFNGPCRSYA